MERQTHECTLTTNGETIGKTTTVVEQLLRALDESELARRKACDEVVRLKETISAMEQDLRDPPLSHLIGRVISTDSALSDSSDSPTSPLNNSDGPMGITMDRSIIKMENEPMFVFEGDSDKCKYTLYPIEQGDIWGMYKKAEACFWTAEEIDLAADVTDWKRLNADEQFFLSNILAFFASSDGIVNENLVRDFVQQIKNQEVQCFYGFQIMMENIHAEMYSLLIDTYIGNEQEKTRLYNAVESIPAIKRKAEWSLRWIDNGTFQERLIAFAAVEGIFFSGAFCSIFWLKKSGKMPGLSLANEFISRDEGLHRDFAVMLYTKLINPMAPDRVKEIIAEAVECEKEFVSESLPVSLLGMNCDLMCQYVEFVADHLLKSMGLRPLYNASNPFDWMELISLEGRTNFFEKRVGEYQKAGVTSPKEQNTFSLDEDF